ncbi:MAG: electron transport complex subunit RsxC [Eubacteriales bacterium]|nr:electron transport complex subunit RsxC [Eubacteriales bacterium]
MKKEKFTFHGGVHPRGKKELSKNQAIRLYQPMGDLLYPLAQHIGAPAVPCVEKGEHVLAGQKIAEAGGFVSAPIYASVSGTITGIADHLTITGAVVQAIELQNDHEYKSVEYPEAVDPATLDRDEILNRIGEAGVVGMGGAGFPTKVKLMPKEPEKIEYILVNGAECEPYLTSDYRLMLERPMEIINGLKIVLQLFPHAKGCICIEDNKMDCVRLMEKLTADEPQIEVKTLVAKYPQGGERFLIMAVTGKQINASQLPADAGCIVNNVETMTAIYEAVVHQKPVIHRIVTITGDAINNPCNLDVPCGTMMDELIEVAGGLNCEPQKIVSGGPMMGFSLFDTHIPTTKTSNCILCKKKDTVTAVHQMPCVNCGRCMSVCPEKLIPARLARFAEHHDARNFEKWFGMECVECGCCTFICPSKRLLAQSIKSMRQSILAERRRQNAKGGK